MDRRLPSERGTGYITMVQHTGNRKVSTVVEREGCDPKRMIAALELLATLVAIKIWGGESQGGMVAHMEAFTDNQGNSFTLRKGMSTKYPLTLLMMEMAEELRQKNLRLDLKWTKRDNNVGADSLTNEDFSDFSKELRVEVKEEDLKWRVLDALYPRSSQLFEEVKALKEARREANRARSARGRVLRKRKILGRW